MSSHSLQRYSACKCFTALFRRSTSLDQYRLSTITTMWLIYYLLVCARILSIIIFTITFLPIQSSWYCINLTTDLQCPPILELYDLVTDHSNHQLQKVLRNKFQFLHMQDIVPLSLDFWISQWICNHKPKTPLFNKFLLSYLVL